MTHVYAMKSFFLTNTIEFSLKYVNFQNIWHLQCRNCAILTIFQTIYHLKLKIILPPEVTPLNSIPDVKSKSLGKIVLNIILKRQPI